MLQLDYMSKVIEALQEVSRFCFRLFIYQDFMAFYFEAVQAFDGLNALSFDCNCLTLLKRIEASQKMSWNRIAVTTGVDFTLLKDNLAEEECPAGESYRDGKDVVPALCKPSLEGVLG